MKKNTMMRIASFLLIAVLLSTSAISGTYAKYVSADEGGDFARVAEWGVVVEAKNFNMFTDKYETEDATFTGQYSVDGEGEDVLAPGTKGKFAEIRIIGTPEVAVEVAIEPTVEITGNWVINGDFYCPVVITVGETAICGLKYDNADAFAKAIADELKNKSEKYNPNTDLSTIYDNTNLDLAWEWAFEDADHVALNCDCAAGAQTDKLDTALGDRAVADELKISIGVKISVTQID